MTPAARVQAAIEILETVLDGLPAEQALTKWARKSRFAGSGDRAAVRDHVFSALRCKRSFGALGGGVTGRGLMIGALKSQSQDLDGVFTGLAYGPAVLTDEEREAGYVPESDAERLDIPDWLWPLFDKALGADTKAVAETLQNRAPVHLRVNTSKTDRVAAIASLREDGIDASEHEASTTALTVTQGNRRIRQSTAYTTGLVELQDAASQRVVDALPLNDGMRVLDYCAGGGGKSLAMAARDDVAVFAYDLDPNRMQDLPTRAERAGTQITQLTATDLATTTAFDLVLCDAPCTGSGSWRRAPEAKWLLTPERLLELQEIQYDILSKAAELTAPNGVLVYVTCSVLDEENIDSVNRFLTNHSTWRCDFSKSWPVSDETDGFFTAHLTRRL